ncbi:MAG: ZIP family metal transporter [Candidatus Aenigmarchaeota archaeon]|nr:ZIP family metal transporter [Candidatus Aenigmarchaeota archaeon]
MALLYIISAVIVVSLISLVGALTIAVNKRLLKKVLFTFVSFAVGTLLGVSFLDLLPEAMGYGIKSVFIFPLLGIISFFILEKFIFWHHRHEEKEIHSFTYMNLIGDGLHNFIDGAVIAASFLHSIPLGVATTIAIAFHEIPQEIGDFGVLIYGGFSRTRALFFNFLSALTAIIGAFVGFLFLSHFNNLLPFLLAFTAGNFIYIAGVDLLPELRKERGARTSLVQLISIIVGILVVMQINTVV